MHPLSDLFTAKEYTLDPEKRTYVFFDCVLHKKFKYHKIEWDIEKRLLRLYPRKDASKKEIKCIRLSLYNCTEEAETVDTADSDFFTEECLVFHEDILKKFPEYILHLALRKLEPNKHICIIGEAHCLENCQKYYEAIIDFTRTFDRRRDMTVDFFFEINYNRKLPIRTHDNYLPHDEKFLEDLRKVDCLRVHTIDYRHYGTMQPLYTLDLYARKISEKLYKRENLNPIQLMNVYRLIENALPLLTFGLFRENHMVIYKQFERTKYLGPLLQICEFVMDKYYNHAIELLNILQESAKNGVLSAKKKNVFYNSPLFKMYIHIFFMDMYTAARILKPGYNYIVLHSGCAHSKDVLYILKRVAPMKRIKGIKDHDECPKIYYPY